MGDHIKNDEYYVDRIYKDLEFIIRYMQETDEDTFSGMSFYRIQ